MATDISFVGGKNAFVKQLASVDSQRCDEESHVYTYIYKFLSTFVNSSVRIYSFLEAVLTTKISVDFNFSALSLIFLASAWLERSPNLGG